MQLCLACGDPSAKICDYPYRDIDGSLFNFTGSLFSCGKCGLGSLISRLTDAQIANYYASTSMYPVLTGLGLGGDTAEDQVRYNHFYQIIEPYIEEVSRKHGLTALIHRTSSALALRL